MEQADWRNCFNSPRTREASAASSASIIVPARWNNSACNWSMPWASKPTPTKRSLATNCANFPGVT